MKKESHGNNKNTHTQWLKLLLPLSAYRIRSRGPREVAVKCVKCQLEREKLEEKSFMMA